MKAIKIGHVLLALIVVATNSCTKDEFATLNPTATITPTTSESEVVLTDEMVGTDVLTVSWPQPDFRFNASPDYYIYLENGAGAAVETLSNEGDLTKTFKAEELNKILIKLGFEPGVQGELKIKVGARLGTKELQSESLSISATCYTAYLDLSTTWGVVGSGYNNWGAFPDAPFFTTSTTNQLVAYVKLITGEIKFRENNDWGNNVGDNGTDGTTETNGANIPVTAGNYRIIFDPVANTYDIDPYSWGIVGSAYNNWGATPDFDFEYDDATDQWRAVVELLDGDMKIRKNNDWGLNYGDDGANGSLEVNGANIAVTAGQYIVTFNEKDLTIEIVPIDHIWGLVGSAYNNWGATPDAMFTRDWRNDDVWILRNVTLLDGEYKFRADQDWGLNYGDDGGNGSLEVNGANIPGDAGIHTITIDFSVDPPTFEVVQY